tara:strand:+ start:38 stop:292 length:255 start_codon:yes stop_codon:yes gene_type:complete
MKEYQLVMNRTYTTYVTLKFPNDDRDHKQIINRKIKDGDQGIWDLITEKELEQMEVNNENWEISEKESIESHWEFDENGDNIIN